MAKIKILLIEDHEPIARNLELTMNNLGYDVVQIVDNSEEALEYVYENSVDLIISDIEIRGKSDGIEAAKVLQDTYNLPIIFTSAYNDQDKLNRASKLKNMVGYLVKPIRIDELDTLVKIASLKFNIEDKRKLKDINEFYKYDLVNKKIYENDKEIELTKNESLLLSLLVSSNEETLSYENINKSIWNNDVSDVSRRQLIHRLKNKLEKLNIVSEKGIGIFIKN